MLVGTAILVLLGWRLGSGPFLQALHVVNARTLLAALLIGVATTVLSAWRWVLVARGLGIRLPLGEAVGDYYRSLFLNAVLPGGVLGDVHRAVRHGRHVGDVALAVKAVVLERFAGQLVLLVTGAVILLPGLLPARLPAFLVGGPSTGLVAGGPGATYLVAVAGLAAVTVVAALALRPVVRRAARRVAVRRAAVRDVPGDAGGRGVWAGRARAWAGPVRRGLLSRGNRIGILVTSAAVLAGHLAMFVVAARAVGSTAATGRLVPLLLLALMAMGLPLNIGGWGPREAVTTWAFAATGLNAAQGLTMAVVYGLFALVASLPGAAVLVARRWGHRGRPASTVVSGPTVISGPTAVSGPAAASGPVGESLGRIA